jgi:hypothetical protein
MLFKAAGSASASEKELAACCTIQEVGKQDRCTNSRRYVSSQQVLAGLVNVENI